MMISKRFENPNGRNVECVSARLSMHGPILGASDINGQHMQAIALHFKLEDGRSIQIKLNQADLAEISQAADGWAEKFSWAAAESQI